MPALSRAGLAESLTESRRLTGTRLIDTIHEDLNKLERILGASSSPAIPHLSQCPALPLGRLVWLVHIFMT
jgi:hypothetical protein